MLRFLFPRLTATQVRGEALFAAVCAEARAPYWYMEGQVPDTLDGRFAMLATITALVMVRLEHLGDVAASVALTERFIEAMKSEHRELGLGDPKLGRKVLKLVGALEQRLGWWRDAVRGNWTAAVRSSVYLGNDRDPAALEHAVAGLRSFWDKLQRMPPEALVEGRL